MNSSDHTAELVDVNDETRGHALKQRRLRLGIKSQRELAEKTGLSRSAIKKAEEDLGASDATYERLEAWFDKFEEDTGHADYEEPDAAGSLDGQLTVTMKGVYGIESITVNAPVENPDELIDFVSKLMREVRGPNAEES